LRPAIESLPASFSKQPTLAAGFYPDVRLSLRRTANSDSKRLTPPKSGQAPPFLKPQNQAGLQCNVPSGSSFETFGGRSGTERYGSFFQACPRVRETF
jgi:hypothetical protein